MEEDSYDPSYLKAETQSQSQDSLETRQESKPTISKKAGTSPICDAEEDSDEELPDAAKVLKERHEREKKAKALQAKKAALLARQQETTEKARLQADVKGKGREIVMDLDSDPEELEIEVVRAATPVIKADHRSPRSHKLMRRLTMKTVKKEHDDDMSESQFKRAGRTFHHGDENVVVNPHVTTKASKSKPTRKHEHAVTSHGVNNLLMEKAKQQALSDKIKRMEDWKRRGGTLRHDHGNEELPQADDDEEISEDRAKELMNAIQARAIDADEEDEDEEGDEDYIGSDEEAILSGEEVGSADEAESVGNDDDGESAIGSDSGKNYDKVAHGESGEPTSSGDISSVATTQVIASDKSDVSDAESEDAIVVSTRIKPTMRMAVEDENSQETSSAQPQMTRNLSEESQAAQATQYHDFVVKAAAPAFPEFDKINDISLTQVFGKVGATQAPPQASRAPLDEADGFSQLFEEDDGGGFSQSTIATQTGTVANAAGPIPSVSI